MAKILHLKLDTGEELVGKEATGDNIESIYVTSPRVLVVQPLGNNQAGVALIPWMIGNPEGTIAIPRAKVTGWPVGDTPKNIEDAYLQQTSGLAIATGGAGLQV